MSAPAGWFPNPDPNGPGLERYWDGATWTSQTRPAPGFFAPPTGLPSGPPSAPTPATNAYTDSGVSPILANNGWNSDAETDWDRDQANGYIGSGNDRSFRLTVGRGQKITAGSLLFIWIWAAAFIGGGLFFYKAMHPSMEKPTTVTATIVDQGVSYDAKGRRSCSPTYTYKVGEQTYTSSASIGSSGLCGYGVNSTTVITVDAANPTTITTTPDGLGGIFPLLFVAIGAATAVGMTFKFFKDKAA